jgi:hypothetical protein
MKPFKILSVFTVLLLLTSAAYSQKKKKEKPPLENRFFTVDIIEVKDGKKPKPTPDKVSFRYDKIVCKFIKEKTKFPPVAYVIMSDSTVAGEDGEDERTVEFMAEAVNDKAEEVSWKGSVSGKSLNAEVVMSKNGVVKKRYSIKGEEK